MEYVKNFIKVDNLLTVDGKSIKVFDVIIPTDKKILDEWATHFRRHYRNDSILKQLSKGSGLSTEDYLNNFVFPDNSSIGVSVKSGDFSEILVSDYLEYCLNYHVPRFRYSEKMNPNESPKGTDVMAFMLGKGNQKDELLVCEVKGKNSEGLGENKLQVAIEDSVKDISRIAFSLEVLRQRLILYNDIKTSILVNRFQNKVDNPYELNFSAAAVYSDTAYSKELSESSNTGLHPEGISLLAIFKSPLMLEFIKELYVRAAKC